VNRSRHNLTVRHFAELGAALAVLLLLLAGLYAAVLVAGAALDAVPA